MLVFDFDRREAACLPRELFGLNLRCRRAREPAHRQGRFFEVLQLSKPLTVCAVKAHPTEHFPAAPLRLRPDSRHLQQRAVREHELGELVESRRLRILPYLTEPLICLPVKEALHRLHMLDRITELLSPTGL